MAASENGARPKTKASRKVQEAIESLVEENKEIQEELVNLTPKKETSYDSLDALRRERSVLQQQIEERRTDVTRVVYGRIALERNMG